VNQIFSIRKEPRQGLVTYGLAVAGTIQKKESIRAMSILFFLKKTIHEAILSHYPL